jgi:4-hydroxy-2-oxoheptanedioate aldolase
MRPNKIKAMWREGKPAAAGWISTGNTYLAEAMAHAGYDAVIIDMQHGMSVTTDKAVACLQAISTTDTVPIVRLPWNDPQVIQFVLDAGAYGVIVPMVNTYEDAVAAGRAARYHPLGDRSFGANRAKFYAGADYLQHANEEIIVLVMIETTQAIENLEEIAKAPGIDGFYIGPSDLALSLDLVPGPDAFNDSKHIAACQRVLDVANATGLVPCHHGVGPLEAAKLFKQGFKLSQIGSDIVMVTNGASTALNTLKEARAQG